MLRERPVQGLAVWLVSTGAEEGCRTGCAASWLATASSWSAAFAPRSSTDSIIPSRTGCPTAALTSLTPWRALANYHLPGDTPENIDYGTAEEATRLADTVAPRLAK